VRRALLAGRIDGLPVGVGLVLLVALALCPLVLTLPFPRHIVIMSLLFATLGTAWNILGGYAGQVSFGHGVYFGIGAYVAAYFYKAHGWSPLTSWPLALVLSALAAVLIGLPTFRLRGHYFVLASVFIMEGIYTIVANWDAVGGAIGIEYPVHRATSPADAFWHLQFHGSKVPYHVGALLLFLGVLAAAWRIQRSTLGLFLLALREEQDAAQSLGVDVTRCKLTALVISAVFTTFAGILYAQYVLYVEPVSTISLIISLEIAFVAIFGGLGTLWGPALGAFIIVPLTELLRTHLSGRLALDISAWAEGGLGGRLRYYLAGGGGNVDILVYGLLIMLIARFQPRGVLGIFRRLD
jgi:branched-chain amino acid transport system permease protein